MLHSTIHRLGMMAKKLSLKVLLFKKKKNIVFCSFYLNSLFFFFFQPCLVKSKAIWRIIYNLLQINLFSLYLLYSKFRSDYICRVRYRNGLPGIPYTAKMLTIPSLMERHASYQTTSLVQQTPYSLTMDQSATIPFDKSVIDYLDAMETSPDEGEF
jgi:hypothetical protein